MRLNRGFLIVLLQKAAQYGGKRELRDVFNKFFVRPGLRDVIENEINVSCAGLNNEQLENIKSAFKGTKGESTYVPLQTPLKFKPAGDAGSGMQNAVFMLIHYKPNQTIEAVNY